MSRDPVPGRLLHRLLIGSGPKRVQGVLRNGELEAHKKSTHFKRRPYVSHPSLDGGDVSVRGELHRMLRVDGQGERQLD